MSIGGGGGRCFGALVVGGVNSAPGVGGGGDYWGSVTCGGAGVLVITWGYALYMELEEGGQKSDVCTRLIYGNAALVTILYVSRNGPLGFVDSGISTHQHPLGACSYS